MDQGELFSKSLKSKSRGRFVNTVLENSIVKVIRDALNACRIPNYRVRERISVCPRCHHFIGQASEEGIPDLVCWVPARLTEVRYSRPLFIEVKRPKGGVESEAQKQFTERAITDGGIAMFARDWDTVADTLRAAGVKIPEGI